MVWWGGLSFPGSWSFRDTAHTCATTQHRQANVISAWPGCTPHGNRKNSWFSALVWAAPGLQGGACPISSSGTSQLKSQRSCPGFCHLCPAECGVSPSLPSPRSTRAVAQPSEAGVCLCRGYLLWLQAGASSRAGADPSSKDSLTAQLFCASCSVNQGSSRAWSMALGARCEQRAPRMEKSQLPITERIHPYFFLTFGPLQGGNFFFKFWPDKIALRVVYQKGFFSGGIYFAVTGGCHCMPSQVYLERLICYESKHLFLLP